MAHKQTQWMRLAGIAALTLLLFGMTAGSLWHTHKDVSSADHCQICHLAHSPASQPTAIAHAQPALRVISAARREKRVEKLSPVCTHKSPRSPPIEA
jgi:hypothetical protein